MERGNKSPEGMKAFSSGRSNSKTGNQNPRLPYQIENRWLEKTGNIKYKTPKTQHKTHLPCLMIFKLFLHLSSKVFFDFLITHEEVFFTILTDNDLRLSACSGGNRH